MSGSKTTWVTLLPAYTLNHWSSLIRYLEDGRLEIDNNRSERLIKLFVIGRKGWLFYDQVEGAKAGAILYSLIEPANITKLIPISGYVIR